MQTTSPIETSNISTRDYLTVAEEVAANLAANAIQYDAEAGLPTEEVSMLKESGLLLLPVPREYGGAGASWPQLYRVVQILASGSYSFDNVQVSPEDIVGPPQDMTSAFLTLVFSLSQMSKVFTYLGIADGALNAAREYTLTMSRPWQGSGIEQASQDPYILQKYGELWADLQAAIALADQGARKIQQGWDKGTSLTAEGRGEIAIAVAAAKTVAIKAGLSVTNEIFEVMGARATSSRYGFDRYWRDLRTFSLHDPRAYKHKEIGNWFLNQEYPVPSQYS